MKAGRWGVRFGEMSHAAKLTNEQVGIIRARCDGGELIDVLAAEFNVSGTTIRRIAGGKYRTDPSKSWAKTMSEVAPVATFTVTLMSNGQWKCRSRNLKNVATLGETVGAAIDTMRQRIEECDQSNP